MDGLQDEAKQVDKGAAAGGGATPKVDNDVGQARADYEAALKERDARIAELEGEIAKAAKTAEGAVVSDALQGVLGGGGDGIPALGCGRLGSRGVV